MKTLKILACIAICILTGWIGIKILTFTPLTPMNNTILDVSLLVLGLLLLFTHDHDHVETFSMIMFILGVTSAFSGFYFLAIWSPDDKVHTAITLIVFIASAIKIIQLLKSIGTDEEQPFKGFHHNFPPNYENEIKKPDIP